MGLDRGAGAFLSTAWVINSDGEGTWLVSGGEGTCLATREDKYKAEQTLLLGPWGWKAQSDCGKSAAWRVHNGSMRHVMSFTLLHRLLTLTIWGQTTGLYSSGRGIIRWEGYF
jgi:hypothetical protein